METQKILRLMARPGIDPLLVIKNRTWRMTKIQIENVLTHVLGRLPTEQEIKACKPDKIQKTLRQKNYWQNKYGR